MQKVLITGLGVGKKIGLCDACNMDFSWLFHNASTMLWVDKICLPEDIFLNSINNESHDKTDVAISIMLQILKEHNLIELIGDDEFNVQPFALENIQTRVVNDLREMSKRLPDVVKIHDIKGNDYLNIIIDNQEYCFPYIESIYASLFIAESIEAQCLFNDHTYTFLKYKEKLNGLRMNSKTFTSIYDDLFSFILPNGIIPPEYVLTSDKKCSTCNREEECSISFEKKTKEYMNKVLSFRDYDELFQLRNEIEDIVKRLSISGEDITSDIIKEELRMRQQYINNIIHRRFEQVKRWSKFVSICSIPATIIAAANTNYPAAIVSASLTGLSTFSENVMEYYESKKKWIGFFHPD